jgi:hypothetical protein
MEMDNLTAHLKEIVCENLEWIHLPPEWGLVVGSYEQGNELWVPYTAR